MAWTVTRTLTVFGNKRAVSLDCTADAATQTIETGLSYIDGMVEGKKSAVTGFIYFNSNASGVQSLGVLGCSGFTSGDQICILVYGRS